jgi:hypothetical protein
MQSNFDNLGSNRLVQAVVIHNYKYSSLIGILYLLRAFKKYYMISKNVFPCRGRLSRVDFGTEQNIATLPVSHQAFATSTLKGVLHQSIDPRSTALIDGRIPDGR